MHVQRILYVSSWECLRMHVPSMFEHYEYCLLRAACSSPLGIHDLNIDRAADVLRSQIHTVTDAAGSAVNLAALLR